MTDLTDKQRFDMLEKIVRMGNSGDQNGVADFIIQNDLELNPQVVEVAILGSFEITPDNVVKHLDAAKKIVANADENYDDFKLAMRLGLLKLIIADVEAGKFVAL
ncbi:hypothetical protein [Vibrio sp. D431a]|uniref:hypothetical protein n=1 Tax=Vibrio sp. D431a TaxID=2837388 RepID=UPI002555D56D|nr:hypothetical protein [Vibrio sp. D431a]MDK9790192.1 hypothetical protein [Vibrio sp. D431a]